MTYAPTSIDLTRIPPPEAIEIVSLNLLEQQYIQRLLLEWDALRLIDPSLPEFTEQSLQTNPAIVVGRAWRHEHNSDRERVNDGLRALLAPLSKGSNLDNLVASRNIQRLLIREQTSEGTAIYEGDASLLRRFLLSFDRPSAGSAGRYLFDAWSAWPQSDDKSDGLWDARVNGRAVHGRRGDTDVVISGPFGREPDLLELKLVRDAVCHSHRAPEAVAISVIAAIPQLYQVDLTLVIPAIGPSADILRQDAETRIRSATLDRALIGGEVPAGLCVGAAYGPGILRVVDNSPVVITPDPYRIPVLSDLALRIEVAT